MATKGDSSPGLLSKMVKFVRNPTRDWSELDQTEEPPADSGFNKEALRQMIERKRQNDFVRKREFDYLRKLRRRETLNGPDHAGRPSFFQSSLPTNPDERAMTLKKIDEIEAQMSRQWWQGKQDDNAARAAGFPVSPKPMLGPDVGPTRPMGLPGEEGDSKFASTQSSALRTGSNWFEVPEEYALTRMDPDTAAPLQPSINRLVPVDSRAAPLGAGFSQSRAPADLADGLTDPDLEEAAIRYANGDAAGAEAGLLAALQGENLRPELAEAWMSALFDLYRATGQQARFDSVALDCAKRFGRSPPAWFSVPEQLGHAAPATPPSASATAVQAPAWTCPAELTPAALAPLRAATLGGAGPRLLDWQALTHIAPGAVEELSRLVTAWCDTPVHLVVRGQAQLERALKALTPSGDRSVNPLAWQLRMEALRLLGLPDEFELVALDYCVTYEVSPPSWQEVRCRCEPEGQTARRAAAPPVETPGVSAGGVELVGEITGDASEALAQLDAGMEGASRLVVSCARLIRVDFPAAGSILNWVAAQEVQGRQVQFRDVNRIVAAFFRVIGINEHARIVQRST
jgi:ABC-type transporter Mla MlaB component